MNTDIFSSPSNSQVLSRANLSASEVSILTEKVVKHACLNSSIPFLYPVTYTSSFTDLSTGISTEGTLRDQFYWSVDELATIKGGMEWNSPPLQFPLGIDGPTVRTSELNQLREHINQIAIQVGLHQLTSLRGQFSRTPWRAAQGYDGFYCYVSFEPGDSLIDDTVLQITDEELAKMKAGELQ